MHEFWVGARVNWRVLCGLAMREMQTRWGRRNLGFAWLFAEPLVFAFPVLAMWSYLRPPLEHGIALIPFMWSGYLPLLIFRHVGGVAIGVVRSNSAMLYHRAVSPLDIFWARCGLEAAGSFAACIFSFLALYGIGAVSWPEKPSLVMVGLLYMTWWPLSVAMVIAALSERTEMVQHIWAPVSYMYMPLSGFFFLAEWLPTSFRNVVLTFDPPVHGFEMIRDGMFGSQFHAYYDQSYFTHILLVSTLIGLWLMRYVRKHIELT